MSTEKIITDAKKVDAVLNRGVVEVVERESLRQKLLSGKKLRVKLGIDPTGPKLHLGRSIPLLKLRDFTELGHQAVLIVGDFTGQVGDTSDKESERPWLTTEQVKTNMADYLEQIGLILDIGAVEVHYNSEWLARLDFLAIAKLADAFSVHEFIEREVIKRRLTAGKRINLRELLYPIMQGYDSIAVKADVEIGGTDQRFNLLAGRTLMKQAAIIPQDILMTELIVGLDGTKMSTSKGNTVYLTASPEEMFGAVMAINDELIIPYFNLLTRVPEEEVKSYDIGLQSKTNPKEIKEVLARELVRFYHSAKEADAAATNFSQIFAKGEQPEKMPQIKIKAGNYDLPTLLVETKLAASRSEGRRLVEQGGVKVDGNQIVDPKTPVAVRDGLVISIGRRRWVSLIVS